MLSILLPGTQDLLAESPVCSLNFGWVFYPSPSANSGSPGHVFHFDRFLNDNQLNGHQITIEWVILKVKIYIKDCNLCLENIKIITRKEVNCHYKPTKSATSCQLSTDCEREFSKTNKNRALSFPASICFRQWWFTTNRLRIWSVVPPHSSLDRWIQIHFLVNHLTAVC